MVELKKRIDWVKKCPVEAAELIERQQKEFASLNESLEEEAVINQQLRKEIEQYKSQEAYLYERIKRLESKLPTIDRVLEKAPRYSDADDQY